jgi:sugar-specific transcriptional regulator TrmB
MSTRMEKQLEQLGLTDRESVVYLASLQSGPTTAAFLAKRTDIKRPTVYLAIESLTKKGLMSSIVQGKKTLYVAENPKNLERLIKQAEMEVSQRSRLLEAMSSELLSLYNSTEEGKPIVRFYEGKDGVESIRRDFAEMDFDRVCSFVDREKMHELFPSQPKITQARVQNRIPSRVIYTGEKIESLNSRKEMREARWISKEKYPFSGDVTVYGNKVALTSFEINPKSVVIENLEFAKLIQALFDLAWDGIKE